jgi:hypothetical protein
MKAFQETMTGEIIAGERFAFPHRSTDVSHAMALWRVSWRARLIANGGVLVGNFSGESPARLEPFGAHKLDLRTLWLDGEGT